VAGAAGRGVSRRGAGGVRRVAVRKQAGRCSSERCAGKAQRGVRKAAAGMLRVVSATCRALRAVYACSCARVCGRQCAGGRWGVWGNATLIAATRLDAIHCYQPHVYTPTESATFATTHNTAIRHHARRQRRAAYAMMLPMPPTPIRHRSDAERRRGYARPPAHSPPPRWRQGRHRAITTCATPLKCHARQQRLDTLRLRHVRRGPVPSRAALYHAGPPAAIGMPPTAATADNIRQPSRHYGLRRHAAPGMGTTGRTNASSVHAMPTPL